MIVTLLVFFLFPKIACARDISIATYNVENLFDTQHDQGKNDWEFTPQGTKDKETNCKKIRNAYYRRRCLKTDWNKTVLGEKIKALKNALLDGLSTVPDILILNEVENRQVFEEFNKTLGYKQFFITDSPDPRGIDNVVAIKEIDELKVMGTSELRVEGTRRPTRNILKVSLRYAREEMMIYAHHWPSPANPSQTRFAAAKSFAEDLKKEWIRNPALLVVALGDFNVIDSDSPHALREVMEKELELVDLHPETFLMGSYFYRKTKKWNLLDRIFVSKNLLDGKGIDYVRDSYRIGISDVVSTDYAFKRRKKMHVIKVPQRFIFQGGIARGASDHYPVSIKLTLGRK